MSNFAQNLADMVVEYHQKRSGRATMFNLLKFQWRVVPIPRLLQTIIHPHHTNEMFTTTNDVIGYYHSYLKVMQTTAGDFKYMSMVGSETLTVQLARISVEEEDYSEAFTLAVIRAYEYYIARCIVMVSMESGESDNEELFEQTLNELYRLESTQRIVDVVEGRDAKDNVPELILYCHQSQTNVVGALQQLGNASFKDLVDAAAEIDQEEEEPVIVDMEQLRINEV